MTVLEITFVYALGALGYGGLETLWRGHTHWTMLLLGGVCFVTIYATAALLRCALWRKWLLCAAAITLLEFLTGCLVNRWLGWGVWDYSALPGSLLGQVCPRYAALWFLLSIPCCAFARAIRRWVFES